MKLAIVIGTLFMSSFAQADFRPSEHDCGQHQQKNAAGLRKACRVKAGEGAEAVVIGKQPIEGTRYQWTVSVPYTGAKARKEICPLHTYYYCLSAEVVALGGCEREKAERGALENLVINSKDQKRSAIGESRFAEPGKRKRMRSENFVG